MGVISFLMNESVEVKRRASSLTASRDSLNNPIYGTPTRTWATVYKAMPCRFAFSQRKVQFDPTGERVKPYGVMYFPAEFTLQFEDRVLTQNGVEYVITGLSASNYTPGVISHWEAQVELP